MRTLDPVAIRETLAGYAVADEAIDVERIERLAAMTDDEARAIDRELYAFWVGMPSWTREGLERLEPLQLESLLAMRQAFARLATVGTSS